MKFWRTFTIFNIATIMLNRWEADMFGWKRSIPGPEVDQAQINADRSDAVVVVGVPHDENSSFLRGSALAPRLIREALASASSNLWTENGIDLGQETAWRMDGDIDFTEHGKAFGEIEQQIETRLSQQYRVVSLGGDHAITYPILRAYSRFYPDLTLVYLDAHPDLYDELDGKWNSTQHAIPRASRPWWRPSC